MVRPPRWIVLLCAASLLWAFSFGLNAPLASLWMKERGASDTVVGVGTAAYYLGIALAAILVPHLMQRWGPGCLVLGMVGSGLTAAAFPWGGGLPGYLVLRSLNGMAGALSLIPLETFVNHRSPAGKRSQYFGCYAFCIALGMALGTLVGMQMFAALPRTAFAIGGTAALLGGLVAAAWKPSFAGLGTEHHERTPLAFGKNFLSFGSAWAQGFLEGGMVALLPIYLTMGVGLSESATGCLMGGVMVGVIGAQVPLAWLADRLGRTAVLAACNVVTLAGIGFLLVAGGTAWLAVWLFVVGACSGALYPLGLALLGERLPQQGLARANAWFLAINCVGSLTGPVIAGVCMDRLGGNALFLAGGAAVGLVLAIWVALAPRRRLNGQNSSICFPEGNPDSARAAA